jgi:hypothetical protein
LHLTGDEASAKFRMFHNELRYLYTDHPVSYESTVIYYDGLKMQLIGEKDREFWLVKPFGKIKLRG